MSEFKQAKINGIDCKAYAVIHIDMIDVTTNLEQQRGERNLVPGSRQFRGAVRLPNKLTFNPYKEYEYEGVFKYRDQSTRGKGRILIPTDPFDEEQEIYLFEGTGKPELEEDILESVE